MGCIGILSTNRDLSTINDIIFFTKNCSPQINVIKTHLSGDDIKYQLSQLVKRWSMRVGHGHVADIKLCLKVAIFMFYPI